jgi:stringent starvation protein B
MSRKTRLPRKKDVVLALLENSTVFLHLDPRPSEVKVPPWFKKQPELVLQVGLNMAVPIPDLNLDDEGVSCTLSFNRSPHFCFVPWTAIHAVIGEDRRGMVWHDDVPPEVAGQYQFQAGTPKPQARLRAVDSESTRTEPAPPDDAAAGATKPAEPQSLPAAAQQRKKLRKKTQKGRAAASPQREPVRAARPMLAPVQEPSTRDKEEGNKDSGDAPKKKRELPPYLRVVK